jgi:hypothetical protein
MATKRRKQSERMRRILKLFRPKSADSSLDMVIWIEEEGYIQELYKMAGCTGEVAV